MTELNSYAIKDNNGDDIVSWYWYNGQPTEVMRPTIEKYILENIIYLLLLIREIGNSKDEVESRAVDRTAFVEENMSYFNEYVLLSLIPTYNIDVQTIRDIHEMLQDIGHQKLDWEKLGILSHKALANLIEKQDITSDEYEVDHLNPDFLFK